MKGVALWELTDARAILDEFLVETDGEETPEIADLFEKLQGTFNQKVEDTALWLKRLEAECAAIKLEEQRLAARRKARENRIERTKRYLEQQMRTFNCPKVNGLIVDVSLQTNPPSVKSELDELALRTLAAADPALVIRVPESFTLNRRAVLDASKAGKFLPAGIVIEQGESLRIR